MRRPIASVIDAHMHVWEAEPSARRSWLAPGSELDSESSFADYSRSSALAGRAIFVETGVASRWRLEEIRALATAAESQESSPAFALAGVVSAMPPHGASMEQYLDEVGELVPLVGIRAQSTAFVDPVSVGAMGRELSSRRLTLDFLGSWSEPVESWAVVEGLATDIPIVIDHLGGVADALDDADALDEWRARMRVLAARPSVRVKLSGLIARTPRTRWAAAISPVIDTALELFGPARCLFGSDWPVSTRVHSPGEWLDFLVGHVGTVAERAAIAGGAARHAYRLGEEPHA